MGVGGAADLVDALTNDEHINASRVAIDVAMIVSSVLALGEVYAGVQSLFAVAALETEMTAARTALEIAVKQGSEAEVKAAMERMAATRAQLVAQQHVQVLSLGGRERAFIEIPLKNIQRAHKIADGGMMLLIAADKVPGLAEIVNSNDMSPEQKLNAIYFLCQDLVLMGAMHVAGKGVEKLQHHAAARAQARTPAEQKVSPRPDGSWAIDGPPPRPSEHGLSTIRLRQHEMLDVQEVARRVETVAGRRVVRMNVNVDYPRELLFGPLPTEGHWVQRAWAVAPDGRLTPLEMNVEALKGKSPAAIQSWLDRFGDHIPREAFKPGGIPEAASTPAASTPHAAETSAPKAESGFKPEAEPAKAAAAEGDALGPTKPALDKAVAPGGSILQTLDDQLTAHADGSTHAVEQMGLDHDAIKVLVAAQLPGAKLSPNGRGGYRARIEVGRTARGGSGYFMVDVTAAADGQLHGKITGVGESFRSGEVAAARPEGRAEAAPTAAKRESVPVLSGRAADYRQRTVVENLSTRTERGVDLETVRMSDGAVIERVKPERGGSFFNDFAA
jgi:hypothetical protein